MSKKIRFVVMGDTHYVQPETHQQALNGHPKGITELADIQRNHWMTENVLPEVISNIANLKPDFVVHTGDIIQGHCDNDTACLREMDEAISLLKQIGAPLFFSIGTHDGVIGKSEDRPIGELLYPAISEALGVKIENGYYSFVKDSSLFIFLDYTTFKKNDHQSYFIKEKLSEENYEHIFMFAHPPLIPVGRPFFTNYDFSKTVLDVIKNHPIDAYFCGHTHNQITSFHKLGPNNWFPQLKSTVLGFPDREPVPLTSVRPLLPDPSTFEYGWGFLEDSAPGWWLITIADNHVEADWYVLRKGIVGQLELKRGQKPEIIHKPPFSSNQTMIPDDGLIKSVRLVMAGSNCRSPEINEVFLNGHSIGHLPQLEYFDCRQYIEIHPLMWKHLRAQNTITFMSPGESMCIGGLVLEVYTESGPVRSNVSPYYTNTSKWDNWNAQSLEHIAEGDDITFTLSFDPNEFKLINNM